MMLTLHAKKMDILSNDISSAKGTFRVFRLVNLQGCEAALSSLGAGITAIRVPDARGRIDDVVLGYALPADYLYDSACAGNADAGDQSRRVPPGGGGQSAFWLSTIRPTRCTGATTDFTT